MKTKFNFLTSKTCKPEKSMFFKSLNYYEITTNIHEFKKYYIQKSLSCESSFGTVFIL